MTRKIYAESVKKWAKGSGIVGGTLIGIIFIYLYTTGAISNVSYSGDVICAGTIEDPCYAYINFTANEDIFIYPTDYDPWGRNTIFNFDPAIKSWKLERSWGNGWREIPLNKSCTGTWCGLSNSQDERKFSVAFREGRNYSLRITAYKNNPNDDIKWGAFSGVDKIDPIFYGIEKYKIYNSELKEVTIRDKNVKELVKIKLLTPLNNYVGRGYQKVAEYEVNSKKELKILVSNIELYDKNDGMNPIIRPIDFKIKGIEQVEVNDYARVCEEIWNDTINNNTLTCTQKLIGSHYEERIIWTDLNKVDFKENESIIVGLFTNVKKGDKIEWIPTFQIGSKGFKIEEWATWTEDLNAGLVAYYKLDETTGDVIDATGKYNGINYGATRGVTGKINNAYSFDGSNDYTNHSNPAGLQLTDYFTFNAWVYWGGAGSANQDVIFSRWENSNEKSYVFNLNKDTGNLQAYLSSDGTTTSFPGKCNTSFPTNQWAMATITYNKTAGEVIFYMNGQKYNTEFFSSSLYVGNSNFFLGRFYNSEFFKGTIDEIGIWNRTLNDSEIVDLYNGGAGITWTVNYAPNSPILNAPLDDATGVSLNPILNVTVSDPDGDVMNVTFIKNLDNSVICTNNSISNNTVVTCTWSGLSELTDYQWYVNVTDGSLTTQSDFWNFTTGDFTNPKWEQNKTNITTKTDYLDSVYFNITLNDSSADYYIFRWYNGTAWVNDSAVSYTDGEEVSVIKTINVLSDSFQINWTFYFNDTFGNSNQSDEWSVSIDNYNPRIEFISPTLSNNSVKDRNWIYVNVSVTEANFRDIVFNLYWSNQTILNSTNYTSGIYEINWTGLSYGKYYYNVTVYDTYSHSNSTETRILYLSDLNLSLEGLYSNISVELNTPIDIVANSSVDFGDIFIDIVYPGYGINYTNGSWGVSLIDFLVSYFRKNVLADGSTSKLFSFSGLYVNDTGLKISSHQYDEVVGLKLNISSNDSVIDPVFYGCNSTDFDRAYDGYLINNLIFLNSTYDGNEQNNVSFSTAGTDFLYFYLDDNSTMKKISFLVSADSYGFDYENGEIFGTFDNFDDIDSTETNATLEGNIITPGGNNPQSFYYDDFEDASINTALWYVWLSNGAYGSNPTPGDRYTYTIDNDETEGYFELEVQNFHEDFNLDNAGTETANNYFESNDTNVWINAYTASNVIFELDYYGVGSEQATNSKCSFENRVYFAGKSIWNSSFDYCTRETSPGSYSDCTDNAEAIENIVFNLTRNTNNTWTVKISGVEQTTGYWNRGGGSADCGIFTKTYNYTAGNYTLTYTSGSCSNSSGSLTNEFLINPSLYHTDQFLVNQFLSGNFDDSTNKGCLDIDFWTRIYYVNQTLLNRTNTTVISESVFDSSADIVAATPYFNVAGPEGTSSTGYLSADNGDNWESITNGVEHHFTNTGRNVKFRLDFDVGVGGYVNKTQVFDYINISTEEGNLSYVTFDFGDDGTIDYTIPGNFTSDNGTLNIDLTNADLSNSFTEVRDLHTHTYKIPLEIGSNSPGLLKIDAINITYDPNPVHLNHSYIQDYLDNYGENETNFTIPIGGTNGSINVSDIKYDYAGGNDTITITAHNEDYSLKIIRQIIYYYSRWDYAFGPTYVNYIEFIPLSPTSKNVNAYGQTSSTPILNITNYGYYGISSNLSVYMNDTEDTGCVNITLSLDNNKSNGYQIGEYWTDLNKSLGYLETNGVWLWADYECNYTNWRLFNPYIYFRQCANNSVCSEELV